MDDTFLADIFTDFQNSTSNNSPSNMLFRFFDSNLRMESTDLSGSDVELVKHCDEFLAQVWRRDRCQNCFQTKQLHEQQKLHEQQQIRTTKIESDENLQAVYQVKLGLMVRDTHRC